jgi:hypothetical protein
MDDTTMFVALWRTAHEYVFVYDSATGRRMQAPVMELIDGRTLAVKAWIIKIGMRCRLSCSNS